MLGLIDVDDGHPGKWPGLFASGGVAGVVGARSPEPRRTRELRVDVIHLDHLFVRHIGFGQEHVHVPGHASSHRVDGVLHFRVVPLGQQFGKFLHHMLRLRDRHAVAGNNDDFPPRPRPSPLLRDLTHFGSGELLGSVRGVRLKEHAGQRAVHGLAHHDGQDEPGRAHQRTGDQSSGC